MGFCLNEINANSLLEKWTATHICFAPKVFAGEGRFSGTDVVRYGEVSRIEEIEFEKKSDYSFKEAILPISETLFYFTEEETKESDEIWGGKDLLLFLRSCDVHALKRLDEIYLNGPVQDYFYTRLRKRIKIALIGCAKTYESCFCVDMKTNKTDEYAISIDKVDNRFYIDCKDEHLCADLEAHSLEQLVVHPQFVEENKTRVTIPEGITGAIIQDAMWDEYDKRCINCGSCNFVCPTCTCFSMQDIFYTDNGRVGERRRVWSSCMVDGFTDVAGGGSYRKKNGERMRFKTLHKVHDFYERHGYHMCVGCGRCDDICPQYISYSECVNRIDRRIKDGIKNEK